MTLTRDGKRHEPCDPESADRPAKRLATSDAIRALMASAMPRRDIRQSVADVAGVCIGHELNPHFVDVLRRLHGARCVSDAGGVRDDIVRWRRDYIRLTSPLRRAPMSPLTVARHRTSQTMDERIAQTMALAYWDSPPRDDVLVALAATCTAMRIALRPNLDRMQRRWCAQYCVAQLAHECMVLPTLEAVTRAVRQRLDRWADDRASPASATIGPDHELQRHYTFHNRLQYEPAAMNALELRRVPRSGRYVVVFDHAKVRTLVLDMMFTRMPRFERRSRLPRSEQRRTMSVYNGQTDSLNPWETKRHKTESPPVPALAEIAGATRAVG
jgi:hypothetical protein